MQVSAGSWPLTRSIVALAPVIVMGFIAGCGTPAQPPSAGVPTTPAMPAEVETVIAAGGASPSMQNGMRLYPTLSPLPTDAPPALTANASMTVIPVPTEVPGLEETIVALATSSPYPTAEQPVIQKGEPYVVSVRRGDLYYEMRLAGDSYLAGENGRAIITVRNDGKDTLFAGSSRLRMSDDQGREPGPFPTGAWYDFAWFPRGAPDDWNRKLLAGEVVTETLYFQLPPAEESQGRGYSLSASTRFSKPMLTHPDRSNLLQILIQVGPISLKVTTPRREQYLKAEWQADAKGYTLCATDPTGKPVENA